MKGVPPIAPAMLARIVPGHAISDAPRVTIEKLPVGHWRHDGKGEFPVEYEWFVYLGDRLARVCPSEGMAREVAAGLGDA